MLRLRWGLQGAVMGAATGAAFLAAEEIAAFLVGRPLLAGYELGGLLPWAAGIPGVLGGLLGLSGLRGLAAAWWTWGLFAALLVAGGLAALTGGLATALGVALPATLLVLVALLWLTRDHHGLRWGLLAAAWGGTVLLLVVDRHVFAGRLGPLGLAVNVALLALLGLLARWIGGGIERLGRTPNPVAFSLLLALALWGLRLPLAAFSGGLPPGPPGRGAGPSILLVAVDGLAPGRLGVYGAREGHTPALDALASRAHVYEFAWTAADATLPALGSLLTGRWPPFHGVGWQAGERRARSIAGQLAAAGYATLGLPGRREAAASRTLSSGFRSWNARVGLARTPLLLPLLDRLGVGLWPDRDREPAARQVRRLAAWWEDHAGQSRFAFVELSDLAPARDADAALRSVDAALGRMARVVGPETWILLTASTGAFPGGGLGEEVLRVPLIVRRPRAARGGRPLRVVRTVDVAPTLLGIAGTAPRSTLDGQPLHEALGRPVPAETCPDPPPDPACARPAAVPDLPASCVDRCAASLRRRHRLLDVPWGEPVVEQPALAWSRAGKVAVRLGRWKLVTPPPALFDLGEDPPRPAADEPVARERVALLEDFLPRPREAPALALPDEGQGVPPR